MKKHFLRTCSWVLILVLLVNMLPMSIFAEAIQQTATETDPAPQDVGSAELSEAYIVDEITEKRTAYSKEFLLSSGVHMAAVYPQAVHYETANGWEEIDNTLITHADGSLSNTAGVWDVRFPGQLTKDQSITIEKDGCTLSFFMAGELTEQPAIEVPLVPGIPAVEGMAPAARTELSQLPEDAVAEITVDGAAQSFGVAQMLQAVAQVQPIQRDTQAQYAQTVPEKNHSRLLYADIYQSTDVVYDLESGKVKESVILECYRSSLRGYRYSLDVGGMIPVLEADGSVTFYDKTRQSVVMVMPAPYLVDNAGVYNGDIQVQLTGSGSRYTLFYILPTEWLAAEDRAWPVILDPIIEANLNINNIRDRTVTQYKTYGQDWGMNSCGYDTDTGIQRFYLKYNDLPELTSSDVVLEAQVRMYNASASTIVTNVEVRKVAGTWDSSTITWENKPAAGAQVEDYAIVEESGWYGWNVTDIVRDWYANENTGMVFQASDGDENGGISNFKQFYSSDFGGEGSRPTLFIYFRNNNGVESYWNYTSLSAGRAGSGHINNFTGNLVWTRTDLGFGGNRMPVSITHVYNLNDALPKEDSNNSNDSGANAFGMGSGWRTNFNQLVYRWSLNSNYYVWEDEDGTDHYFEQKDGVYKDEEGLELTLTDTGSGNQKYCITDKDGACRYFDTNGRLTKVENNQQTKSSITVAYATADGKQISTVTDGVGRVYEYVYTNGLLSSILFRGTGTDPITRVNYGYTENRLTSVTDVDGKSCTYGYSAAGLLNEVRDIDTYKLTFSFAPARAAWQPYRVLSVTETDGTAQGGSLSFAYGHNQTTLTDHNGNVQILQFNDYGNLTCIQDDEGNAQFAQYALNTDSEKAANTDSTAKVNQLRLTSELLRSTASLLADGAMRTADEWEPVGSEVYMELTTSSSKTDTRSLEVTACRSCNEDGNVLYDGPMGVSTRAFSIPAGKTYTFSCYIKPSTAQVSLVAQCGTDTVKSETLSPGNSWSRLQVSYTNTTDQAQSITYSVLAETDGYYYIDCVQLEQGHTASRYNMVKNGDFNLGSATGWTAKNCAGTDGLYTLPTSASSQLDGNVIRIKGNPFSTRQYTQTVYAKGKTGYTYILAGWAKANAAPGEPVRIYEDDTSPDRGFSIQAVFNYADGTTSDPFTARFNPDSDQWQYSATAVVAEKNFNSITVTLDYSYNVNTVYFDGIQLNRDEFGDCYTYDEDGNVVSVVDDQSKKTEYEYTANNLTKEIIDGTVEMTYTYDDWHNVATATTKEGLVYSFTYDTYGNNTAVSITADGKTMTSTATYTSDGNRMVSTTNALGKVTTYHYHEQTNELKWVQYPEDTEATRTNYEYDTMYRTASIACTTDTGNALSVAYDYEDDQLKAVTTPSTTYRFDYGTFDLCTQVRIGSRILASYDYTDDGNYYLETLDYGNGDQVQYTYDEKGRITGKTYEDDTSVTYTYDDSGFWTAYTDSATGITTTYTYDLMGRLRLYEEKGPGHDYSLKYSYTDNKLTYVLELIDGYDRGTRYTYDEDDRLVSVKKAYTKRTYAYDGFNRATSAVTSYKDTNILGTNYTFADTETAAVSQVATLQNITTGADTPYNTTYSYQYDDNGNIISVTDGTNTTAYTYDSANQLIREDNQAGGFTHTWTYDNAGNILCRKEYAYTTGDLADATPTDTVSYSYVEPVENAESETDAADTWGDLLRVYDGQTFAYDEIGNLTDDGTWTYTWQRGRQLASMEKTGKTWSYTYNAEGMRTRRTDGDTVYEYVYAGGDLVYMSIDGEPLRFSYSADGMPMSVIYKDSVYFYVTNLQGDVVALVSSLGNTVVEYTYDAWGNILTTTGRMATALGQANPLRYRGYVYDNETGLYYLQSRYYNPEIGRFINADVVNLLGANGGFVSYNLFAYCNNNPVMLQDPTGNIAITTLILIGSAIVGAACAGYTAYIEYKAGFAVGQIIGDSICAGFAGFSIVYSGGISLYQCYQNYCYLNAITPVTNVNIGGNISNQLQVCANKADAAIPGKGPVVGTKKHTVFATEVKALNNGSLRTEVSYKNGDEVSHGTAGSIRFDVVQMENGVPIAAWDLKTGSARLYFERLEEMRLKSGFDIPIYPIYPTK